MKSLTDSYTLRNGVKIPCIGFGTWQIPDGPATVGAVKAALEAGYRHIDNAFVYANEKGVGAAIRESGIPRKELFVTNKLWNTEHGYRETLAAFESTMRAMGLEYLDLYLIHWPNPVCIRDRWEEPNAGTWKAFEELYAAGRIRAIGISNFHPHHIEALMKTAKIAPMVNQIRLCPGDTQDALVEYCRARDIFVEAYSPFATGLIFDVPEMRELARAAGKSVAQVCVRWSLQMGFLPLPKSAIAARIWENAAVFDFELTPPQMRAIAGLQGCCGYAHDPDKTDF
jgi:diketogulonate reductase-like aldo/keto reductase